MATTEKYTTVIELNAEQTKRHLDELRKKVESWKSDLAEAREKKMGKNFIAAIRKELTAAEKELKKYDNEVARTIDTMNNIGKASIEQIEDAQKSLLRLSKEVPHDSDAYKNLTGMLDQVTQELENIKATKAFEQLQMEAAGATKAAVQVQTELAFTKQTADNAETASVKQLQLAERTAQNIKNSTQKGSNEWNQASAGLEKVRTRLTAIEEEERKIVSTIDRYEKEIKEANKSIEVTQRETKLVNDTLAKLSSASIRDIEYSIKILNEQLRDTERTGGNVEELTAKLKQLNEELKKVQDMQKPDTKEGKYEAANKPTVWDAISGTQEEETEKEDIMQVFLMDDEAVPTGFYHLTYQVPFTHWDYNRPNNNVEHERWSLSLANDNSTYIILVNFTSLPGTRTAMQSIVSSSPQTEFHQFMPCLCCGTNGMPVRNWRYSLEPRVWKRSLTATSRNCYKSPSQSRSSTCAVCFTFAYLFVVAASACRA